jgi:hypothetical protein
MPACALSIDVHVRVPVHAFEFERDVLVAIFGWDKECLGIVIDPTREIAGIETISALGIALLLQHGIMRQSDGPGKPLFLESFCLAKEPVRIE